MYFSSDVAAQYLFEIFTFYEFKLLLIHLIQIYSTLKHIHKCALEIKQNCNIKSVVP